MDSTKHSERHFSKVCIVTYGRREYVPLEEFACKSETQAAEY